MRNVVMGVAACGKSTVAQSLARELSLTYVDGDAFHPAGNLEKLSRDIPLTDEDRYPWLEILAQLLAEHPSGLVLACSALKRSYRDMLRKGAPDLKFVFLDMDRDTALLRLKRRAKTSPTHVLKNFDNTVDAQFKDLESPVGETGVIHVSAVEEVETIVKRVTAALHAD